MLEFNTSKFFVISTLKGFCWAFVAIFLAAFLSASFGGFPSLSITRVQQSLAFGVFTVIFGSPILIIFGLPIHLLFFRLRITSVYYYISSGFIGGVLAVVILRPFGEDPISSLVKQALFLGGFGVLASFVFWLAAVKIRERS
jgi:hypothetical protein